MESDPEGDNYEDTSQHEDEGIDEENRLLNRGAGDGNVVTSVSTSNSLRCIPDVAGRQLVGFYLLVVLFAQFCKDYFGADNFIVAVLDWFSVEGLAGTAAGYFLPRIPELLATTNVLRVEASELALWISVGILLLFFYHDYEEMGF